MFSVKKYLFYFSCCLFLLSCKKEEQLSINTTTVNIGESINIQHICFVNSTLGFACGGTKGVSGSIYKTSDGGNSWQKIYSENPNSIYCVSFLNDTLGFACGENLLLLKTINGGQTWTNQHDMQGQPPTSYNSTLRDIFCLDDKNIFVTGGNGFEVGLAYWTIYNATFWKYTTYNNELRSVYFKNASTGYMAGYGSIIKTNDTSNTWRVLPIDNDFFVSICFPTPAVGYACGYNGGIYKTTDEGNSWSSQLKNNNDINHTRHFNQIQFLDANEGYAVGNNGLVEYTSDGGSKWEKIKTFTEDNLFSVAIKNKHEIFITGANGNIYILKP